MPPSVVTVGRLACSCCCCRILPKTAALAASLRLAIMASYSRAAASGSAFAGAAVIGGRVSTITVGVVGSKSRRICSGSMKGWSAATRTPLDDAALGAKRLGISDAEMPRLAKNFLASSNCAGVAISVVVRIAGNRHLPPECRHLGRFNRAGTSHHNWASRHFQRLRPEG